jgi:glycosyltransferase involved in cell wall biosynthesis
MALAVPCVATQVMGVPELIRDGVDGLLVAPADPAGLAEAMARLMDSPGLRQRLAASGRQRVLAGYNLGQNVARLSGIFQRRLATRVALRN